MQIKGLKKGASRKLKNSSNGVLREKMTGQSAARRKQWEEKGSSAFRIGGRKQAAEQWKPFSSCMGKQRGHAIRKECPECLGK